MKKYTGFLLPIQGVVIQFCLSEVPLEFVQVMDELWTTGKVHIQVSKLHIQVKWYIVNPHNDVSNETESTK